MTAHRLSLFLFVYAIVYNYVVVCRIAKWGVDEVSYSYHVVDYSLGFRTSLLPGAIFSGLFKNNINEKMMTAYETVLIVLFFIGLAYFLEKFILSVEQSSRKYALITVLFYLSGPFTFAVFTRELGMLDTYWLFFSLLFFIFIDKKYLRFLIPVLYALSMLVHFSAVLNYLILLSIIILYRVSVETNKKEKRINLVIFAVSLMVTAGFFILFMHLQSENVALTRDAFHQHITDRGGTYFTYYDYAFFNSYYDLEVVPGEVYSIQSPVLRLIRIILGKIAFTMYSYASYPEESFYRITVTVLLLAPIMVFLYKRLVSFFKGITENRLKKFCVFLIIVQFPFTAIVGSLFSPDTFRWATHAFLVFTTCYLVLLSRESDLRTDTFNRLKELKELYVLIYALTFAACAFWPYC